MIKGNSMTKEESVPFAAEIFVSNLNECVNYYVDVLGFTVYRQDDKGKFAVLQFNNSIFMIQEEESLEELKRVGVLLRFIIPDVKTYYNTVKDRGANIFEHLESTDYGLIMFKVKDPEGYIIKFAEVKDGK